MKYNNGIDWQWLDKLLITEGEHKGKTGYYDHESMSGIAVLIRSDNIRSIPKCVVVPFFGIERSETAPILIGITGNPSQKQVDLAFSTMGGGLLRPF